jgi:imidazolonepropionase-like amidohydrolase
MQAITPQTDLRLAVAMARGTGASAIKVYADLPPDLVAAIAAEAHRQGVPIWAHAMIFPTTPMQGIAAGADVVSHACMLAYEASEVKPRAYHNRAPVEEARFAAGDNPAVEAVLQEMKRRGVILDATDHVYVEMARAYARRGGKGAKPYCSPELAEKITRQAYRDGVAISTGTDGFSPAGDPYPAIDDEIELLVDKAGLSPMDAIRSATLVGARAAGRAGEMGSIEPGKLANLVILAADPLKDIRALRQVTLVVKRGRPYPRTDYRPLRPGDFNNELED